MNDYPCKCCQKLNCEDCQNEGEKRSFDTYLLREYISGLDEVVKIPFIEQILREEGLEPI